MINDNSKFSISEQWSQFCFEWHKEWKEKIFQNFKADLYFQITETVVSARTWLAIAGILLEQVRLNNNRGYGTDIQKLEDQGLYWMMCGLYKYLNNRHIVWTARIDTTVGQYEYSTIRNNGHHQGDHDLLDLLSLSKCADLMEYLQQEFSYISQMNGN